jgi:uncharacterized protein YhaN
MKILRLDLRAFGPFSAVSLDLSAGSQGFHLVYGPNEAGKSSALRALRNLLYGIPGNTADDFVHNKPNLRIAALLSRGDGQQLEIVRRKGNKGTLLPPDEKEPLDESVLRTFLGGCDQAQFETMFGIDHAGLIAGGQEIIRGQGDIGHVLFAAGAGISNLRTICGNLEKQAEDLFRPNGSKQAVNRAIAELNRAKKLIRESQLPSSEWQKHKAALEEKQTELTTIEERLADLSRQKTRFERLAGALPTIARLRECDEKLSRLGDVPVLPADFTENRRDTIARLETARRAELEAGAEIARLDGLIAAMTVPEGLTSRAAEIEAAHKDLGVYRKAQTDLPGLIAKREQLEKEAGVLLKELRPDLTLADAEQLKLARRQQVEIQNLGNRKQALDAQRNQARKEIAENRQCLAETCERLAELPPPSDPTALTEAIRRARSEGNPTRQASALRAEIDALETQATIDLQKLGLWTGSLDAVEILALPAMETIDRFDRDISAAQAIIARLQGALEKAGSDATLIDRELDRLRLEGELPSETDLVAARKHRETGWQLVLQDWRGQAVTADALQTFLASTSETSDLAAAYQRAVCRADELSDGLRREAKRVASRAALHAQRLSHEEQISELTHQHVAALERLKQLDSQWRQAWQPAGIDPLPPREMQAWKQRQEALVQQAQTIRLRWATLSRLEDQIAAHCRQLQVCLDNPIGNAFRGVPDDSQPSAVGNALRGIPDDSQPSASRNATEGVPYRNATEGVPYSGATLDALLARGETLLKSITETADAQRNLERERNRFRAGAVQAEAKAAQAEADLAEWRIQWATAIRPLGLPEETSPVAVNEVLAQTGDLLDRLKDAASYSSRIADITRDSLRFREDVERLLVAVDPNRPSPGDRFQEALEELISALRRAIADQKKLDLLKSDREKQDESRRQAHNAVEPLQTRLALLCQEAHCRTPEELPAVEASSAGVLRLRQEREALHGQLLQLAAGATVDALMAEAATIPTDSLPGELQRINDAMSDLDRTRGEVREAIGGEKRALDGMDTSPAAAIAAEDAQEILARLEPDVRHYLRLRLASAVLREGIERYRKKNEGPVLARASELFQRLTLGSFESLRIDFSERDEQLLAGVRLDGKAILPSAMSEGTCDQLYLAVRLASLETWLARNEPMPLIVDDILVSFDNRRAVATLEVLAELSRRTQVIFFTHHEHLVDLASQCMPPEVLFEHKL